MVFSRKELTEKIKFVWGLWAKKDNSKVTYCNLFVHNTMELLYGYKAFKGCLANNIHVMMKQYPEWKQIDHETLVSHYFTNTRNHSVIVASKQAKPNGHVVVLLPGEFVWSGKWNTRAPLCANIGKNNFFGKGVNWAFQDEPEYFLYTGDKDE